MEIQKKETKKREIESKKREKEIEGKTRTIKEWRGEKGKGEEGQVRMRDNRGSVSLCRQPRAEGKS